MKEIPVAIIHPMDPDGRKIGGIETFVSQFVDFSPPDFRIRLVGITTDPVRHPPGRWIPCRMGEREIDFFPLHYVSRPERKPLVPLSLTCFFRIVQARPQIRAGLKNSLLTFHRPECVLPFLPPRRPALLFVHSHPGRIGSRHSASRWRRFSGLYARLEKPILERMERVYCVSREALDYYHDRFPAWREKFEFQPTGVNHRIFYRRSPAAVREIRERFLAERRLAPDTPLVLFVGRFVAPKNFPLLLAAFAAARRRRPGLKLLLVGEGRLEREIRTAVDNLGLGRDVLFLGRRRPEEIAGIIPACSVFLSTSAFEGMPISLLEALNCGLPAVVTGVGETKNVVRDGESGRVVFSADPEALAGAVEEVISRPDVYTPEKAIAAVEPYLVEKTLAGVYLTLRELL
jgi:glycosyltransferase involved in cell wall biosynthesis